MSKSNKIILISIIMCNLRLISGKFRTTHIFFETLFCIQNGWKILVINWAIF